jgi:hypothetical protein
MVCGSGELSDVAHLGGWPIWGGVTLQARVLHFWGKIVIQSGFLDVRHKRTGCMHGANVLFEER